MVQITDDFNRADGGLSANWSEVQAKWGMPRLPAEPAGMTRLPIGPTGMFATCCGEGVTVGADAVPITFEEIADCLAELHHHHAV